MTRTCQCSSEAVSPLITNSLEMTTDNLTPDQEVGPALLKRTDLLPEKNITPKCMKRYAMRHIYSESDTTTRMLFCIALFCDLSK